MSIVTQDWDVLRSGLERGANGVAAFMRTAPSPSAKIVGLDWTVSELSQHVLTEARRHERFGRGQGEALPAAGVGELNARDNAAVGEKDPAVLAGMFLDAHRAFMNAAKDHAPDDPYVWFDQKMTWADAAGIYLGELNIHAIDFARTIKQSWTIQRSDALQIAYGLLTILPGFVNAETAKGFTGSYLLKLRGGESVVIRFANGSLTVEAANGTKADCNISADPAAFLMVGYGRSSQWGPIARGKIMASGRKPWLGLKFNKLLLKP